MAKTNKQIAADALASPEANPKARALFKKSPEPEVAPPPEGEKKELKEPAAPVTPAAPPERKAEVTPETTRLETETFFAAVAKETADAFEAAFLDVKLRSGIRSFAKADITEALFRVFIASASEIDVSGLPRKAGKTAPEFRELLAQRIKQAVKSSD